MTSVLIIPALSPPSLTSSNDDMTENPIHGLAKSVIWSSKQDSTRWVKTEHSVSNENFLIDSQYSNYFSEKDWNKNLNKKHLILQIFSPHIKHSLSGFFLGIKNIKQLIFKNAQRHVPPSHIATDERRRSVLHMSSAALVGNSLSPITCPPSSLHQSFLWADCPESMLRYMWRDEVNHTLSENWRTQ